MTAPRFRIRLDDDDKPELYCYRCRDWWPVTSEFWPSRRDFSMCRACRNEYMRLYHAKRMLDPEFRLKNAEKSRRYRQYVLEHDLAEAQKAKRQAKQNEQARERRARAA